MKYIDAEKLKKLIDEKWKELADKNVKVGGGKWDAEISTYLSVLRIIDSLQQELPGIEEHGVPGRDYIPVEWVDVCEMYGRWKIVQQEQPEVDLEKASRNVYESWMGGTMDDVRRDMVKLGKVLTARKKD